MYDTRPLEKFRFTYRFLHWKVADGWDHPMYRLDMGNGQTYPDNYVYNKSSCSVIGCGQIFVNSNHTVYDYDFIGSYHSGIGAPGNVPVPYDGNKAWTVQLSSQYLCKVKNLSVHLIPTFRSLFGHVLPLDTYHPLKR